jgi:formylglycine-generating enzyme required for sulfatase activity
MVWVPPGEFETQEPDWARLDYLPGFYIDQYEVSEKAYHGDHESDTYTDLPMVSLTWEDADRYCRLQGKRLPSNAEWEKAARGADGRVYPWGDESPDEERANLGTQVPSPIGSFDRGKSPYGAYDMAGNVFDYAGSAEFPSLRGGAWSTDPSYAASGYLMDQDPTAADPDVGFRCLKDKEAFLNTEP